MKLKCIIIASHRDGSVKLYLKVYTYSIFLKVIINEHVAYFFVSSYQLIIFPGK